MSGMRRNLFLLCFRICVLRASTDAGFHFVANDAFEVSDGGHSARIIDQSWCWRTIEIGDWIAAGAANVSLRLENVVEDQSLGVSATFGVIFASADGLVNDVGVSASCHSSVAHQHDFGMEYNGNKLGASYGDHLANGDAVTIQVDMDAKTLSFHVNGCDMGVRGVFLSSKVRFAASLASPGGTYQRQMLHITAAPQPYECNKHRMNADDDDEFPTTSQDFDYHSPPTRRRRRDERPMVIEDYHRRLTDEYEYDHRRRRTIASQHRRRGSTYYDDDDYAPQEEDTLVGDIVSLIFWLGRFIAFAFSSFWCWRKNQEIITNGLMPYCGPITCLCCFFCTCFACCFQVDSSGATLVAINMPPSTVGQPAYAQQAPVQGQVVQASVVQATTVEAPPHFGGNRQVPVQGMVVQAQPVPGTVQYTPKR